MDDGSNNGTLATNCFSEQEVNLLIYWLKNKWGIESRKWNQEEHFVINVDVAVSDQFLGWIMSLGDGAVIEGPTEVVDRMKQMISGLERIYSLHDSSKTDN